MCLFSPLRGGGFLPSAKVVDGGQVAEHGGGGGQGHAQGGAIVLAAGERCPGGRGGQDRGQTNGGGHDEPAGADGPHQRACRRARENERNDDVRGQQGGAEHGGEEGLVVGQSDVEVDGGAEGELDDQQDRGAHAVAAQRGQRPAGGGGRGAVLLCPGGHVRPPGGRVGVDGAVMRRR